MHSGDLRLDAWKAWCEASIMTTPGQSGVYAFRAVDGSPFQRLKGCSDILYIGCTATKTGTIRNRLAQHFESVNDHESIGWQIKRVGKELVNPEGGHIEVGWKVCKSHEEARLTEGLFLRDFIEQHFELPPLNRQESAKEVVAGLRGLRLSSEQMIKIVQILASPQASPFIHKEEQ